MEGEVAGLGHRRRRPGAPRDDAWNRPRRAGHLPEPRPGRGTDGPHRAVGAVEAEALDADARHVRPIILERPPHGRPDVAAGTGVEVAHQRGVGLAEYLRLVAFVAVVEDRVAELERHQRL